MLYFFWFLSCIITYLPTFGNQKSEHFYPPPSPSPTPASDQSFLSNSVDSLEAENQGKRKIEADQSFTALRTEIHEALIRSFRLIKEISSHFAQKWSGKILIYALKITFKTRIFTGWNSRKSGRPDFWRFWKSKIGTVPIKPGQFAGM